jgi:class 3 adenylate cyclase/tetratricopeptide (TPR) repeat protein
MESSAPITFEGIMESGTEGGTITQDILVALNADVVSYSRLLADDPDHTASALSDARTIVDNEISAAGGTLVNFVGDNFMAVFDECESAIETAIAVSSALAAKNILVPEFRRLRFRMGVDRGPVLIDADGSYLGDALNIAARIQSIAQPGGLSVSGDVYRALDEPALRFHSKGRQRLKNIPEEIEVFDFADLPSGDDTAAAPRRQLSLETPRVAIVPMHVEGATPELQSIATFLLSDVTSGLVGLRNLDVVDVTKTMGHEDSDAEIAPNVRYVLYSGIVQVGTRVRLWAQALEVFTQNAIWAQKWDTEIDSLLDMADQFAEEIVRAFEVELIVGEPARIYHDLGDPKEVAKVYETYYHLTSGTASGWNRAREIAQALTTENPDSMLGLVMLSFTNWMGAAQGFSPDPEQSLVDARADAERANELGDETGLASMVIAAITLAEGDADSALDKIAASRISRPTCDLTFAVEASVRRYLGQWEEAVELVDQAMGLSPVNKPWYPTVLASSYYVGGRYEQAAAIAEEVLEFQPQNIEALLVLAASQSALGLDRRARATGDLVRERFPQANVDEWLASNPYQDDRFVDRWRTDLEGAGLDSD